MSKKDQKKSGAQAFDEYFYEFYAERWHDLKTAFAEDPAYVSFRKDNCQEYFLDSASGLAACCLPISSAFRILDMCAAPGGKSLVIASRMNQDASLKSNEFSKERYIRLKKNIEYCLPPSVSERVSVTCFDGATWCKFEKDSYDAILLDAPCSSERHVWNDPSYLKQWTPARIKNLAMKQWSLLSSAFLCLKSGGSLLYATCALSPDENDGPVRKLLKKYPDSMVKQIDFEEVENQYQRVFSIGSNITSAEKTAYGYHILPDSNHGAGPLYFCLIQKQ